LKRKWRISELDSLSIIKLGLGYAHHLTIIRSVWSNTHQHPNDDQIRARIQLLRLALRAKYSSSTDSYFFGACSVDGLGYTNTVSVNGVWMRLVNLSYGQDR